MFSIVEVVKRGWWNTLVIVAADQTIDHEEKRIRYSGPIVARIDTWRIRIESGETFTIKIPTSVGAKIGDKLTLDTIKGDPPFRDRWKKTQSF